MLSLPLLDQLVSSDFDDKNHIHEYSFVSANGLWGLFWCIFNIAGFGLVVLGMRKSNKLYLLPALAISLFDVGAGIINFIISLALLQIPS